MTLKKYHKVPALALFLLLSPQAAWGETAPAPPQAGACNRSAFRTIIDVGHTLEEPGANSARGVAEYQFNLDLAKAIERKLTSSGFGRTVLLVTSGPAMKGLIARVRNANAMQADLYLSVHHDSVPEHFLENWEHDGKPNRFSDRFTGHSLFVSFDNPQIKASLQFGKLLGIQLRARGLQFTRHYTEAIMGSRRRDLVDPEAGVYRYDKLIVLRTTAIPAVLLEAGVIVNRDDEKALASPERQTLTAAAVTDAVDAFCGQQATEKARLLALAKSEKKNPREKKTEEPRKPLFSWPANPFRRKDGS
jgi:N-acetylmuramoyl-L-alanine amidase